MKTIALMHIPGSFRKKLQLVSNFHIKFELMCYMICIGCYGHPMACVCLCMCFMHIIATTRKQLHLLLAWTRAMVNHNWCHIFNLGNRMFSVVCGKHSTKPTFNIFNTLNHPTISIC